MLSNYYYVANSVQIWYKEFADSNKTEEEQCTLPFQRRANNDITMEDSSMTKIQRV
mgnify:FL=1|jgi:hypothetical protein